MLSHSKARGGNTGHGGSGGVAEIDAVELLSRKHIPVGEKNAIPDPLSRGVNCSPNIRASVENLRGIFLESDHFAGRQRFDTPRKPRDQALGYPPFPSLGIKQ